MNLYLYPTVLYTFSGAYKMYPNMLLLYVSKRVIRLYQNVFKFRSIYLNVLRPINSYSSNDLFLNLVISSYNKNQNLRY